MNSLKTLMVMLVCVIPSYTSHHGNHRRHRHHEHRFLDIHHHREHGHTYEQGHDHSTYMASQSNIHDNSLYERNMREESVNIDNIDNRRNRWMSPYNNTIKGLSNTAPRWIPGEGVDIHGGSSQWALTYPGTTHHQPSVINNTLVNITAQLGGPAFLPCCVGHLGDRQISWIRRRDWHVITSGDKLYSLDKRFSILHVAGSQDWTLHIKSLSVKDAGTYECHVSTGTGIISLFVNLKVVIPQAYILGKGHYHLNYGSPITLTCIIRQSANPPQEIFWYHNGNLLNYAHDRPEVQLNMKVGRRTYSRLEVANANDYHSGNYSCSARNTRPAYTTVFITEGDKTAAVQRIDSGSEGLGQVKMTLLSITLALLIAAK